MSTSRNYPSTPFEAGVKLQNGDGTGVKAFVTAPANGVMLGVIRACSDDSVAVTLQFSRSTGGSDYVIGEIQVPAGAGTNGTTGWVDVLEALNLGEAMNLAGDGAIKVKAKTAVTAGKTIDLVAEGGAF